MSDRHIFQTNKAEDSLQAFGSGQFVSGTSHATPGTEVSIAHTLGRAPRGFFISGQGAAGSFYNGSTANTSTAFYIRCDAASVAFTAWIF